MGANFQTMRVAGNLDRKAVEDAFGRAQQDDRHENGHSYSGGFGMAEGLNFTGLEFADDEQAIKYLDENCVKWSAAKVVKVGDHWLIGAHCAS